MMPDFSVAWCIPTRHRVIVLYPPTIELPDPLKKYQGVKCEATADGKFEDVDRFFQDLFNDEPYPGFRPINTYFALKADRSRREAAEKIIQAVGRLVVELIVPKEVMLVHVPDVARLDASGFPEGTRIKQGSGALHLFEIGDTGITWQAFQDRLESELA